jgi:hypothetical protein
MKNSSDTTGNQTRNILACSKCTGQEEIKFHLLYNAGSLVYLTKYNLSHTAYLYSSTVYPLAYRIKPLTPNDL